jgi:hypothetical protein
MDQDASRRDVEAASLRTVDKRFLLERIVAATDELQYRLDLKSRARERVAERVSSLRHGPAPAAAGALAGLGALVVAVRKYRRRHRD